MLSFAVLDTVKAAQAQNGLRHNDFARYRAYCARRLERIRKAKAIKFIYGKGKKYTPRELTPEMVTDVRHLMIPLYNAERAWALSQELKAGEMNAVRKSRMLNRLQRAVKWAEQLQTLCAARGDARTGLEAEAYAAVMRGTLCMERSTWPEGVEAFGTAQRIYEQLSKVATRRLKELYMGRIQEVEPNERYCRYNLMRRQGASASKAAAAAASAAAAAGGAGGGAGNAADRDLQTKIDAALAESLGARGDGVNSILWRKTHITVRSDKVKASLAAAQDKAVQLSAMTVSATGEDGADGGAEAGSAARMTNTTEAVYLELLSRYDDVSRVASSEAARAGKEGRDAIAQDLKAVDDYARFVKARHVLERSLGNIHVAAEEFYAVEAGAKENGTGSGAAAPGVASPDAKRKRGKKAKGGAGAGAGAGGGGAADEAADGAASTAPSLWAASALHTSLRKSATGATTADAGAPAVAAANQVAAWYARAIKTVDEMCTLAGATPTAASEGGASTSSARTASAGAGAGAGTAAARSEFALPEDDQLIGALAARKLYLLSWRCWFVALSYLHAKRFSDAAALLRKAQDRAAQALAAYRALPGTSGGKKLPPIPGVPGLDDAAFEPFLVAAGVSAADLSSLEKLQDLIATRNVAIQATGLLERLAPRIRADAELTDLYLSVVLPAMQAEAEAGVAAKGVSLPIRLVQAPRPAYLTERVAQDSALEPTADADLVAPFPPLALPVPVKPILFDLAHTAVEYPDSIARAVASLTAAASPATAKAPAAKSGAAPATPGKAAVSVGPKGVGVGPGAKAGASPAKAASPATAAAPAPAPAEGGGLLSRWLGGSSK